MPKPSNWLETLSAEEREAAMAEIKSQVADDLFVGLLNRGAAALIGFTIMALSLYALIVRVPMWVHDALNRFL